MIGLTCLFGGGQVVYAQSVELDFSVEASIEYATDQIMTEEYGNFFSPFLWVDDFRAGTILTVSGTREFGGVRLKGLYSRDQVWHNESTNLDWTKHISEISLTSEPTEGTQLWMRYKAKNGVPNGWQGDMFLDIVTSRLRFPEYQVNQGSMIYRPYVMLEWEKADPTLVPPLTWEEVTGEVGLQMRPGAGAWVSDVVVSYGQKETVAVPFRHDFVDLEWVHAFPLGRDFSGEFDVSYRREWYDGPSADDGSHRFDEEFEAIFELAKPLRDNVTLKFKFEVEEHISNRSKADFLETKSKMMIETRF